MVHGVPGKNIGSLKGGAMMLHGLDRTIAIDWVSEGIDDTAKELGANGHVHDLARTFHGVRMFVHCSATRSHQQAPTASAEVGRAG